MKTNLLFLALGLLLFVSCSEDIELENDYADVTIAMRAFTDESGINLELWDDQGNTGTPFITTQAEPNYIIQWVLAPDSKINQILNIYKKEDSADIFEISPYRVKPGVWEAKVASWAEESIEYNIDFEYEDGTVVVIDPIIEIPQPPKY